MKSLILLMLLVSPFSFQSIALSSDSERIERLERKISWLENRVSKSEKELSRVEKLAKDLGPLVFLFGAFCALWAQNSGRNAWLWFFMGVFFNVFTVLALLYKNEPRT